METIYRQNLDVDLEIWRSKTLELENFKKWLEAFPRDHSTRRIVMIRDQQVGILMTTPKCPWLEFFDAFMSNKPYILLPQD